MNFQEIIVGPVSGGIIGFAVWYFQSRITKLQEEQKRLNDDRRKVYAGILEPFIRIFAGIKNPKETAKAIEQIQSFNYKKTAFEFNMVGSDSVVRAFNNLMQFFYDVDEQCPGNINSNDMINYWGQFLIEVRKSLGNPKTKLTAIDMFRSLIKNIEKKTV